MAKKNKVTDIEFIPRKDQVVLAGHRKEHKLILLNTDGKEDDSIMYERLEVVSFGPLVKDLKVGDRIKLSDSIVARPDFLYCNYTENETPAEGKIDYLLVAEAFIKGTWVIKEETEKE